MTIMPTMPILTITMTTMTITMTMMTAAMTVLSTTMASVMITNNGSDNSSVKMKVAIQ